MGYSTEAYVCRGAGGPLFTLENIELTEIGPNELLVEPVAVSICHTDVYAAEGSFPMKPPLVPGHEGSGYVKKVGADVTTFKPGDAVVLSYASCSACTSCRSGRNPYCEKLADMNFNGKKLDGSRAIFDQSGQPLNGLFFGQSSMSKLIVAHESSAVKVDATTEELKTFASLGCGIQTGAGAVLNVLKPRPGSSIAVWGGGAVGIAALLAASLSSPSLLILIDMDEKKLQNSNAAIATHKVNNHGQAAGETTKKLMEITNGKGVDFAIDAVGSGKILGEAQKALAACGTLLSIGSGQITPEFQVRDQILRGATWRGTHQGDSVSRVFIPHMISLWKQGKFPFDKMLTFFDFSELDRALASVKDGECIKPVLLF